MTNRLSNHVGVAMDVINSGQIVRIDSCKSREQGKKYLLVYIEAISLVRNDVEQEWFLMRSMRDKCVHITPKTMS